MVILTAVMTTPDIPLLDISTWRDGNECQRARIAGRMDQALRQSGFLLIENHGVPAVLRDRLAALSAIQSQVKRLYAPASKAAAEKKTTGMAQRKDHPNSQASTTASMTV